MKPTKKQYSVSDGIFFWNGSGFLKANQAVANVAIPAIMQKVVSESTVTTTDNGDGTFTHTFDFTKGQ